jgi:hypothetical protein
VPDARTSSLLAHAQELERRDRELADQIRRLTDLTVRVETVRRRAEETLTFLTGLPEERRRLRAAHEEAERDVLAATKALDAAVERRLEAELGGKGPAEAERRAEEAARRVLDEAVARVERLERRLAALEERAEAMRTQALALEDEAGVLAAELSEIPRVSHGTVLQPPARLEGIPEWGARVEAALLVARSGLETERERVVREANELASSLLGEQTALSVAQVRERLERALRHGVSNEHGVPDEHGIPD